MTIRDIYNLAIKMGIEADPRGEEGVRKFLERKKTQFEGLSGNKKEEFDKESLANPYADTRILYGNPENEVKRILMGIDIETGEVLLADRLSQKGKKIDLLLGHHPHGAGLAALNEVMEMQADIMASFGVPVNIAEGILKERIAEVRRRISPKNHYQSVDVAKILEIPFICIHTPFDNLGYSYLNKLFEKEKPETVGEVLEILMSVPEFKIAARLKNGPSIFAGSENSRCGKVVVGEFTGGTEGSKEMYEKLAIAGVGTIVGMHVSEEHRKEAEKHHINLVIAGHMVSDSLGANLFLDELEKMGIEIITCSGMIRVKRTKAKKL